MTPDDLIRKRARKIVDAGDVPKATLQESITLNEKVDALIEEVKKKDLLEYDLQIDEDARLHLKGDKGDTGEKGEKGDTGDVGPEGKQGETGKQGPKGEDGKDGKDGVDGIDGIDGKDGKDAVLRDIKISDVKELPETIATLQNRTQLLNQMVSSRANSATGGAVDSVNGQTGVVVITEGVNEDSFGIVVDGAGTAITTGSKGVRYIPFDCTVTGWDIRSDISGSCVFDVKRSGVSLAGTEKPTLTASTSNQDLALSTWTTSLLTGDVVEFVVDSASTLTRATLTILVTKL